LIVRKAQKRPGRIDLLIASSNSSLSSPLAPTVGEAGPETSAAASAAARAAAGEAGAEDIVVVVVVKVKVKVRNKYRLVLVAYGLWVVTLGHIPGLGQ